MVSGKSYRRNQRDELAAGPDAPLEAHFNFTQNIKVEKYPAEVLNQLADPDKEWLKRLTEKEQDTRHAWIFKEQENEDRFQNRKLSANLGIVHVGQIITAVICLAFIGGCVFLVYHGKSSEGFGLLGSGVAAILGMGFFNRRNQTAESAEVAKPQKPGRRKGK